MRDSDNKGALTARKSHLCMPRNAAERLIQLQAKDWLEHQVQDQQN